MSDRTPPGVHTQTAAGKLPGWAWVLIFFGVIVVGSIIITAVSSSRTSSPSTDDKYTQTWSKSYSSTTCTEWKTTLTDKQQFAGAADMLTSARNKMDGGTGLPADYLIDEFADGISTACVIPTASLAEVAVGVYLTEPRFAP